MAEVIIEEIGSQYIHYHNSFVTFKVSHSYYKNDPDKGWYALEISDNSYGDMDSSKTFSVKPQDLKNIARMFNLVAEKVDII